MARRLRALHVPGFVLTAFFLACSPFGSSSDEARPSTADSGDGTSTDAGAGDGSNAAPTDGAPDGPPPSTVTSCASAPANVFCDDFSSGDWRAWNIGVSGNPEIKGQIIGSATIAPSADTPSLANVATFELLGRDTTECTYAWARASIDVTASSYTGVTYAFDMRLETITPQTSGDDKDAVALFVVKDTSTAKVYAEHYLFVGEPGHAKIYEQWKDDVSPRSATHELGSVATGSWMHVALAIDALAHQGRLSIDGEERSRWDFGETRFGRAIGVVSPGIGYVCTTIGGKVRFDNVIVTAR